MNNSNDRIIVLKYVNEQWIPKGNIIYRNTPENLSTEMMGEDLDLSYDGDVLVFGVPRVSETNNQPFDAPGIVNVYRYFDQADSWGKVGGDIENSAIQTGKSVAINDAGNIIAVSGNSGFGAQNTVTIFQNINDDWVQVGDDISVMYDDLGIGPAGNSSDAFMEFDSSGSSFVLGTWNYNGAVRVMSLNGGITAPPVGDTVQTFVVKQQ